MISGPTIEKEFVLEHKAPPTWPAPIRLEYTIRVGRDPGKFYKVSVPGMNNTEVRLRLAGFLAEHFPGEDEVRIKRTGPDIYPREYPYA